MSAEGRFMKETVEYERAIVSPMTRSKDVFELTQERSSEFS